MIQFNLLPDVKLEYIRAERMKRMVMTIAILIATAAVVISIGLYVLVNVVQKGHLANLDKDIKRDSAKLKSTPNLDKILTVQNQLVSLPTLHQKKPNSSRFIGYLAQLTPAEAHVSQTNLDFSTNTVTLDGTAKSLEIVNKFVDTLKFTKYTAGDGTEQKPAFSAVVMTSFGVDEKGATYQLSFTFDPLVFDNTKTVTLVTPKIVSTRSATEKPTDLFQPSTQNNGQTGQ